MAICLDCGAQYKTLGLDLVLPDQQWRAVCPENGILCANCICRRARKVGGTALLAWIDNLDCLKSGLQDKLPNGTTFQETRPRTADKHRRRNTALRAQLAAAQAENKRLREALQDIASWELPRLQREAYTRGDVDDMEHQGDFEHDARHAYPLQVKAARTIALAALQAKKAE